ncbi:MAG: hypothetical protein WCH58_02170 [Candidatus Saccharibacteria bacterium]
MSNKKKIIIVIVSILIIGAATASTIFILKSSNKSQTNKDLTSYSTDTSGDKAANLITQADTAALNEQKDAAVKLYEQARQIYVDAKNTDGIVATDGKIYEVSHQTTSSKTATQSATGSTVSN